MSRAGRDVPMEGAKQVTVETARPNRIRVREALSASSIGRFAYVAGWVRTRRTSKAGVTFVELNDGSSLQNLQVIIPEDLSDYATIVDRLSTGASAIVTGEIVASPAQEQETELRASSVEIIGP